MSLLLAASLLSPNVGLIFWIGLVFLLLLFLLSKFAWPAIASALREREHTIESSLLQAERALAEAKQLSADNERARREAQAEARQILAEAKTAADELRASDIEKTKADIQHMKAQAAADIERQKQQAIQELRSEVAELAVEGAEKILRQNLDRAAQQRLVEGFIADLPGRAS